MKGAILIAPLPLKRLRRLAQVDGRHAINHGHHFYFEGAQRGFGSAIGVHPAQFGGKFAQFGGDQPVHVARIGAAFGLRHHRFGYDAVLFDEVDEHVPLAAVLDGVFEQVGEQTAVYRLVGRADDALQKEVRFFDFVPEHGVGLRQLKLLQAQFFHGRHAEQVQPGEHPAAAAGLLRGDLVAVQGVGKGVVGAGDDVAVGGHGVDVVFGDGVAGDAVFRVGLEVIVELLGVGGGDNGRLWVSGHCVCSLMGLSGGRLPTSRRFVWWILAILGEKEICECVMRDE